MAAIISISIKKEDFDKLDPATFIKGKTATYIPLSLFIDDKGDKFGNNVSMTLGQSQKDREAKKPKVYLGNGKVVWVNDGIKTAKEIESSPGGANEPF